MSRSMEAVEQTWPHREAHGAPQSVRRSFSRDLAAAALVLLPPPPPAFTLRPMYGLIAVLAAALLASCGADGSDDPTASPRGSAYCADVLAWTSDWEQYESEVLRLGNEQRGKGADCGGSAFGPAAPLSHNGLLRCAARVQSRDMATRSFFDHQNPDGDGPAERAGKAGYSYSTLGENIAAGYPTPEAVVAGWMGSPGHCRNLMNPNFTEIGVGYYAGGSGGYGAYWTQVFGAPR
jgi:uncharacterized protein YkwD